MAETKARFCDVCGKLVDKEVYGKLEWQNKYNNYWRSETNTVVCASCWRPLWEVLSEIGEESLIELVTWLVNPYEESRE